MADPGAPAGTLVVLAGNECSGKSTLARTLTGAPVVAANLRGTTVACETARSHEITVVDTPGILRRSDSVTTGMALDALADREDATVALVVSAVDPDQDLHDLLPLVAGRRGVLVLTFWDKVRSQPGAQRACRRLERHLGVPVIPLDARRRGVATSAALLAAVDRARPFPSELDLGAGAIGLRSLPRRGPLERAGVGPLLSLILLLAPAVLAVWAANTVAGWLDPIVAGLLDGPVEAAGELPSPAFDVLVGDYGVLTMLPLLFVWALPTVAAFALLVGLGKASGLLDRLSAGVDPLARRVGLAGRDLVRILMGFGCNVPAVISSRSCSGCTRSTCVHGIAFGSACSYQLGATLAVFAAAGASDLVVPYLLLLAVTTAIYLRATSSAAARDPGDRLHLERRVFLVVPRPTDVAHEAWTGVRQLLTRAAPVFVLIALLASVLDLLGLVDVMGRVLAPLLALVGLPGEAAVPIVLASLRKDGILLFGEPGLADDLTRLQLLCGVYLAGVLVPCLVTAITIAREVSPAFAGRLLVRQATAALLFTAVVAMAGRAAGLG